MVRLLTIWATFLVFSGLQSTIRAAESDMVGKLLQFGYLEEEKANTHNKEPTPEELGEALRLFQKFNGLKETGIYDEPTQELLSSKRCGNKDVYHDNDTYRPASFNAVARWSKTELTWNVVAFSRNTPLSQRDQLRNIQKGLEHWSRETGLTFKKVPGRADIMISFEKKNHGDNNPFDGKGGVLAHAFFPGRSELNGDTHFDDDEFWTEKTHDGTNLEIVAAHEFGHALGLGHSSVRESLMAPYYRGYIAEFKLHADDIKGIQRLYGTRNAVPSTTTTTTTKPTSEASTKPTTKPTTEPTTEPSTKQTTTEVPTTVVPSTTQKPTTQKLSTTPEMTTRRLPIINVCNRPQKAKIQAAFTAPRGDVYIFLSDGHVISNTNSIHKIEEFFPKGPKFVDAAAYSDEHSLLFLFRGVYMFMYTFDANNNTFSPVNNFMKKLEIKVDAATIIRDNYGWERVFLFAGGYMQEYHQYLRNVGDRVSIAQMWYGAPEVYDAVIADEKEINFLHGDRYTTVDRYFNVVVKSPRPIKTLLRCD